MLVASQFQYWSKLSSGSIFAPEFPRAVVILFNWAGGAILFLALLQLLADAVLFALWLAPEQAAPMALTDILPSVGNISAGNRRSITPA
jgi:uncharacterized protein